jgi:hypothetical protein
MLPHGSEISGNRLFYGGLLPASSLARAVLREKCGTQGSKTKAEAAREFFNRSFKELRS